MPAGLLLLFELIQYFTLAYRFDRHEIVVARGLIWKRERHIPYARVQNIELVQHAAHRLAGVAVVRLDTGAGAGAEAELAVLSLAAIAELRDAVRIGRRGQMDVTPEPDAASPAVLVALDVRELLLHGLLTASGWVVIAAGMGALWQIDLDAWGLRRFLPSTEGVWGGLRHATPALALEIGILIGLAVLIFRLLSAVWSAIKHFEFTLTLRGDELFQSYGLLTRVGRTIPRSRIQKLHHLGGAADAAARPRHGQGGHRRRGAREAQAAGDPGQPRPRAHRAGVAPRHADPGRASAGTVPPGSRRAGLARHRPARVPPPGTRAARLRGARRRRQLRRAAPVGDRRRLRRRRGAGAAGVGDGTVHRVRLVGRHAVLPQRHSDAAPHPRPRRPGSRWSASSSHRSIAAGGWPASGSTPPAPRPAATTSTYAASPTASPRRYTQGYAAPQHPEATRRSLSTPNYQLPTTNALPTPNSQPATLPGSPSANLGRFWELEVGSALGVGDWKLGVPVGAPAAPYG